MKRFALALALLLPLSLSAQQRPLSEIATDLDRLSLELKSRPEVIAVHAGENVTTALAFAKGGDSVVLDPGVKYAGPIILGEKASVVTLRSSAVLPDRRITPNDAFLLPIITGGVSGIGATNWLIDGVQFESTGVGDVVVLQDAVNVTLNRVLIVGGATGQKRGVRGNGQRIAVTGSHITNIWASGQDSQAFCAWDGAGPYTLIDNYLEAAGENVMFGGADSKSVDRIPSDIYISRNTFTKQLAWKGTGKSVKNLLEFKVGRRVIVQDNDFSVNYTDAQNGYAILVKSVNQGGTAPWSVTEDIVFERNVGRALENGFNILGVSADQPGGRTTRVTIRHNDFQLTGVALQVGGGVGELTVDRNTFNNGWTFMQLYGAPTQTLFVRNNLANHSTYGVKGQDAAVGTPSLVKFATVYAFTDNVLIGGAGKGVYPTSTYFTLASVPAGVEVGK